MAQPDSACDRDQHIFPTVFQDQFIEPFRVFKVQAYATRAGRLTKPVDLIGKRCPGRNGQKP